MKSRRLRLRSRILDLFVVILCLFVCAYSFKLFYAEYNRNTIRDDKAVIAQVVRKSNISQRKFSDRVVWERVQNDTLLYNGDILRTGDNSETTMQFTDLQIDMGENSMMQIFYSKDEGISVSVNKGNIELDASDSVNEVQLKLLNGTVVNVKKGSRLSAQIDSQAGENFIVVSSGQAVIQNSEGNEQIVNSGESVKENKDGELQQQAITITSIPLVANIVRFENEDVVIPYKWNASAEYKDTPVIIQLSKRESFNTIELASEQKDLSQITIPAKMITTGTLSAVENKKFYWRIFPKGEMDKKVTGVVNIISIPEVKLLSPINDSYFHYTNELVSVPFSWDGNDYVTSYKLEVAKDNNFRNKVFEENIKNSRTNLTTLEAGEYFWRIIPFYSIENIGNKIEKSVGKFTIVKDEINEPPILKFPAENDVISLGDNNSQLLFMWESFVDKASYKLLVSDKRDFSNLVIKEETPAKSVAKNVNINTLAPGIYYWKVVRNSPQENHTVESKTALFEVKKTVAEASRLLYPPENYSVSKQKFDKTNFVWAVSSSYKDSKTYYVLEVCEDKNFQKNVVEIITDKTQLSQINLPAGNYFWRVGIKLSETEKPVEYTEIRSFNILGALGKAEIVAPESGGTVIIGDSRTVTAEWTVVPDADYYTVKLIDSDNSKVVTEYKKVAKSSVRLELPSEVKVNQSRTRLKVQVQPYSEAEGNVDARDGEVSEISFVVRKPMPITLSSPADKTEVITAMETEMQFAWKVHDKADEIEFILKKQNSSGVMKTIKSVKTKDEAIKVGDLTAGTYEWTVKGSSKKGYSLDAVDSRRFTIIEKQLLPKPVLVSPVNNFVIDGNYLQNNKTIKFTWNKSENAGYYSFALYSIGKNGAAKKLLSSDNIKSTEYILKDFSVLDVGTFEWRVVAYSKDAKGRIQKSETSTSSFKIQFELPSDVETIDPGRMYGN